MVGCSGGYEPSFGGSEVVGPSPDADRLSRAGWRRWAKLGTAFAATVGLAATFGVAMGWREGWSADAPSESSWVGRAPHIRPDYCGTVFPPNIAPPNFVIEEPGTAYTVKITGPAGSPLLVRSRDGGVQIPMGAWKALLAVNRGKALSVEVFARDIDRSWRQFEGFRWQIAEEEIDPYLVYRMLDAVYDYYKSLGIYQRNLESSEDRCILFNSEFNRGCVNCHSFANNRPEKFLLHARPGPDASIAVGPILVRDGKAERLRTQTDKVTRAAFVSSWHPNGELAAFCVNWFGQFMRATGAEPREVVDLESDLAIINVGTGQVSTSREIADPDRLETFPCWSADGKYLFFSSAPRLWGKTPFEPLKDFASVKYDLMRVAYDAASNRWGTPEVLLSAAAVGKSLLQPRASPDGRHLLFCLCGHGPFPAFQENSDLAILDLTDRSWRRLDNANSNRSESWHSWSSNSRWIVFSSRRDNGLAARPYFCYLDRSGKDHKAFLLPQRDPRFYDTCLQTYNVPEFVTGPITVSRRELIDALRAPAPGGATGKPAWSGAEASAE